MKLRSFYIPSDTLEPEPLQSETAIEFRDDLALLAARLRQGFTPVFSVSKHRSIYLSVYSPGPKLVFTARISDHYSPKPLPHPPDFDRVMESLFQSEHENDTCLKDLEEALFRFLP